MTVIPETIRARAVKACARAAEIVGVMNGPAAAKAPWVMEEQVRHLNRLAVTEYDLAMRSTDLVIDPTVPVTGDLAKRYLLTLAALVGACVAFMGSGRDFPPDTLTLVGVAAIELAAMEDELGAAGSPA